MKILQNEIEKMKVEKKEVDLKILSLKNQEITFK
jgi:hypothetical protein